MKTGLNFYTTTIINSDKYVNGKSHFKADTNAAYIYPGMTFFKDGIQKVYYKEGYEGEMAKVEVDLAQLKPTTKTYYRLDIYVKVQGAEPYIYATPWIQKGRPFWVEFSLPGGTVATAGTPEDADAVVKAINKEHIFQVGDDQITAEVNGTKVVLTATTDYLRFARVEIVKLNDEGDDVEVVGTKQTKGTNLLIKEITKGQASFGTYSHIIKDIQLPTNENTRWMHLRQDETPIIGAIYDQFIIEYTAEANNRPLGAVGCEVKSHTTHTFWVKKEVSTAFKEMFSKSDNLGITITTVNKNNSVSDVQPTAARSTESPLNTQSK